MPGRHAYHVATMRSRASARLNPKPNRTSVHLAHAVRGLGETLAIRGDRCLSRHVGISCALRRSSAAGGRCFLIARTENEFATNRKCFLPWAREYPLAREDFERNLSVFSTVVDQPRPLLGFALVRRLRFEELLGSGDFLSSAPFCQNFKNPELSGGPKNCETNGPDRHHDSLVSDCSIGCGPCERGVHCRRRLRLQSPSEQNPCVTPRGPLSRPRSANVVLQRDLSHKAGFDRSWRRPGDPTLPRYIPTAKAQKWRRVADLCADRAFARNEQELSILVREN